VDNVFDIFFLLSHLIYICIYMMIKSMQFIVICTIKQIHFIKFYAIVCLIPTLIPYKLNYVFTYLNNCGSWTTIIRKFLVIFWVYSNKLIFPQFLSSNLPNLDSPGHQKLWNDEISECGRNSASVSGKEHR